MNELASVRMKTNRHGSRETASQSLAAQLLQLLHYSASAPVSPVRIRTTSLSVKTKILPRSTPLPSPFPLPHSPFPPLFPNNVRNPVRLVDHAGQHE